MTAIEYGCPYSISVGSFAATFNQPADGNMVGYINDVTGLDMYGVRENAQATSGGDGGYHGAFWRDRRPFTISGFIFPSMPVAARSAAQDKITGVMGNCFRQDGSLLWTPSDGIQRNVMFRVQQPVRFTRGQSNVERNFMIAGVARDWRIRQQTQSAATATSSVALTNLGNADAAPKFTFTGTAANPIIITNTTSGKKFTINQATSGGTLIVDLTGVYPVITYNSADWSQYVDPLNSDYTIACVPGANTFTINSAVSLTVNWNNSWH